MSLPDTNGILASTNSTHGAARRDCKENIQVFIRIRPLIERENVISQSQSIRAFENGTIEVRTAETTIKCKYDAVFDVHHTQEDVYERVCDCIKAFLDGYNATLFAYGQTGSGKSYTMFGAEYDASKSRLQASAGIIPRAVNHIFSTIRGMTATESNDSQAQIFCSFVQIYNEQVYDLLRDENMEKPLEIHEDRKNGIYVNGLSEYAIANVQDCLELLHCGEQYRAVRSTYMNQVSSRSHSVFQLLLEQRRPDGTSLKSKLNLVDLAGSEKWNMDSQMLDHHIAEMTNINLSLHTLGRCIAALSSAVKFSTGARGHVPYRDSKLTRLLQDSLGGNTKTKIIATLSPSSDCIEESISTLKFADRAKQVMVSARINEQKEIDSAYVAKLEQEVSQLRGILALIGGKDSAKCGDNDEKGAISDALSSAAQASRTDENGNMRMKTRLVQLVQENAELRSQLERQRTKIDKLKGASHSTEDKLPSINNALQISEMTMMKERLETTLRSLKYASDQFFRFEIEEEELRQIYQQLFEGVVSESDGRRRNPASPVHSPHKGKDPGFRPPLSKSAVLMSPGTPGKAKPLSDMMYRVRGRATLTSIKKNFDENWQSDAKNPEKDLEAVKQALAKQAKLQEWYIEKERRELAKVQQERDLAEANRQLSSSRDAKFYKNAAATKKKLIELRKPQSSPDGEM